MSICCCFKDKAKYEIMTGHWKTADELINMYSDLVLHANSGVLGLIDPLHPKVGYHSDWLTDVCHQYNYFRMLQDGRSSWRSLVVNVLL